MIATYRTPGLIVGVPEEDISEDELTKLTTVTFADAEAFAAFEQDAMVQASITIINAYNDQHDIIRTVSKGFV
jgi:hypothetical protein